MTNNDWINKNTIFLWIALFTILILAIPLVAMQISEGVNWTVFDFTVMAMLLFGVASFSVLIGRRIPAHHRIKLAIISLLIFLYGWVELAVGVFFNLGS